MVKSSTIKDLTPVLLGGAAIFIIARSRFFNNLSSGLGGAAGAAGTFIERTFQAGGQSFERVLETGTSLVETGGGILGGTVFPEAGQSIKSLADLQQTTARGAENIIREGAGLATGGLRFTKRRGQQFEGFFFPSAEVGAERRKSLRSAANKAFGIVPSVFSFSRLIAPGGSGLFSAALSKALVLGNKKNVLSTPKEVPTIVLPSGGRSLRRSSGGSSRNSTPLPRNQGDPFIRNSRGEPIGSRRPIGRTQSGGFIFGR